MANPVIGEEELDNALYTHCAACGWDLTDKQGRPRRITDAICPHCGSEDIIEAEMPVTG